MTTFWDYAGVLVLYVALQVAWILLVRTFPDFICGALLKRIERRNALEVEKVKNELNRETQAEIERFRADYANLKFSVDFMSASQREVRLKMIESAESLWGVLCQLGQEFGPIIFIDTILQAHEIDAEIRAGKPQSLIETLEQFRPYEAVKEKLEKAGAIGAEKERIFVSSKLWLLFFVLRALYGRAGMLINFSLKEKKYRDWRSDSQLDSLLTNVVAANVVVGAKKQTLQGLRILIGHIENEFLAESARIMSGTHLFSDNISELQTALTVEKEKVAASQGKAAPN